MSAPSTEIEALAINNDQPRNCTCYPDDAPVPCPRKYALWDCQHEAVLRGTHKIVTAARITELEAALKPFACEAHGWPKETPDDFCPDGQVDCYNIGDLRRAETLCALSLTDNGETP